MNICTAIVPEEALVDFDRALLRVKMNSPSLMASRIITIVPGVPRTLYEVSLTADEAVFMALATGGSYTFYDEESRRQKKLEFIPF
jgi:hypothetical protein